METATILVVDDEALIAMLGADALEIAGYRVVLAHDGRAALEKLAAEPPDLVVTDYMMPRLDGLGLARAMRADPMLREIPIMLVSAAPGDVVERHPELFDAFLQKPYSLARLTDTVRRLLGRGPSLA